MRKKKPPKATCGGLQRGTRPLAQRRPALAPVRYPIGEVGENPSDFIRYAAKVLSDSKTSIYVDTSFLTWLTKGGDESRRQFLDWATTTGARIHVPVWSYHEYYRHNGSDTLREDIKSTADHLVAAANNFIGAARTIADNPLKPGFTSHGYQRDLEDMLAKVRDVVDTVKQWDYHTAAKQISSWMSDRLCRSKVVFDLMNRLGDVGATRYTQDVPPGYLDREKKDEKGKGSNKFGDLVMWEEVLAHAAETTANAVVILTRDRKSDWFAPAAAARAEIDMLTMRDGQKWNPVPAPHPTLLIELQERTLAADLVLLDNLYFGAVLHQMGDAGSQRLIAYALGVKSANYSDFVAKAAAEPEAPPKRPVGDALSKGRAKNIFAALAPLQPGADPTALLRAAIDAIHGDPPSGLQFVDAYDQKSLSGLSVEEAAELARLACDAALTDRGHVAESMSKRLLTLIPLVRADLAGAVFAGMLSSAYFEVGGGSREVPTSPVLQDIFNLLNDPIYTSMLEVLNKNLEHAGSIALFKPKPGVEKLPVLIKVDTSQQRIPVVLSEIIFDGRTLTREMGPAMPNNLRRLLGDKEEVPVAALLSIVAETYGLPLQRLVPIDTREDEQRTIPEKLGLVGPMDLAASDPLSDAATEEPPIVGPKGIEVDGSPDDIDEDMLEAQAERDEDHE